MNLRTTNSLICILFSILISTGSCIKDLTNSDENSDHVVKLYGGSSLDKGIGIAVTADGGYAMAGTMKTSANLNQAVLLLTDQFGNNLPVSPIFLDDTTSTYGNHLLATTDGGYLITGSILKKETGINNLDIMVVKVKADGSIAWLHSYGGNDDDEGYCALELSDGSFMIGGYTSSIGNGKKDMYILRLNNNGTLLKQLTFGSTEDEDCRDIIASGSNLILVGSTKSFGFLTQSVFIVKITSEYGIIDMVGYNGTTSFSANYSGVKAIVDTNGDIVILSNFTESASSISGIYLLKLDGSNLHTLKTSRTIRDPLKQKTGYDLLLNENQLIIIGTDVSGTNYDFSILTTDNSFNPPNEFTIKAEGNQIATSGIITPDAKLAFTGSSSIGQKTKIAFLKIDLPK